MARGRLAALGHGARVARAAVFAFAALALSVAGCVDGTTPDCSAEAGVSCGPDFDANIADVIPGGDAGDGAPKDAAPGDATDAPAVDAPADSPPKG